MLAEAFEYRQRKRAERHLDGWLLWATRNEIVRILRDERGFAVKRGRVHAFLKWMRGAERDL